MKASTLCKSLLNLVYPDLCHLCHNEIRIEGYPFCMHCFAQLPFTQMESMEHNEFTSHFKDRLDVLYGVSLFYLNKGSGVADMIHKLKYSNKPFIGIELGSFFGTILKSKLNFSVPEAIIPVPLHKKKERIRGYNQSEKIARGLSQILEIPVLNSTLKRNIHTATQTRMDRIQRLSNMEGAFELLEKDSISGKHLLLVDDVLTTGATLEACARELIKADQVKISLMTLAMGK